MSAFRQFLWRRDKLPPLQGAPLRPPAGMKGQRERGEPLQFRDLTSNITSSYLNLPCMAMHSLSSWKIAVQERTISLFTAMQTAVFPRPHVHEISLSRLPRYPSHALFILCAYILESGVS